MSVERLCESVWADEGFQRRYLSLQLLSAEKLLSSALQTEGSSQEPSAMDQPPWGHLLRCASIFLNSDSEEFYDAGLRIVHTAVQFGPDDRIRNHGGSLLARSANGPALSLAIARGFVTPHLDAAMPMALQLEAAAEKLAATINFENDREFVGNRFQIKLWQSLEEHEWVSASAPTSVGKSFLLERWIEEIIQKRDDSVTFYIVPTRALIGQVERNLRDVFRARLAIDMAITSLPLHFATQKRHQIYIYTQERYHLYLLNHETEHADLVIIDEAHKIGGGRRGVLLQQVLELSTKHFPRARYLFASPSTRNPEALLRFTPDGQRSAAVSDQIPTVNQNLFWLTQKARQPRQWAVELLINGERHAVGGLVLENKPSQGQKLAFLSYHIGGFDGGNVVYVNRASDAEDTAELICQHFDELGDPELDALSELCEKAVHPQFRLRRFVRKGVAFHYGNIPQLIRAEVERLFSAGKIKYLVCTSTLIEGMNLACRNVFMRHPKRGTKELMAQDDFWNLAGRAGRWGKEFQGNIFCIDPLNSREWVGGHAPTRKVKQEIEIATSRAARDFVGFLRYVNDGPANEVLTAEDRYNEQLLSYFSFRKTLFGDLGQSFSGTAINQAQLLELDAAVTRVIEGLTIPIGIIQRNPGIDPRGIEALYRRFQEQDVATADSLAPADPLSDDAVESFIEIFSRITRYLRSGRLGQGASAFASALLVVNWMRGLPLAQIIDRQMAYERRRAERTGKKAPSQAAVIRNTMERVETIARFEAPKYLHCYIDVLNHFLTEVGREDLVEDVRDIWVFLEFGVAKRTELSLMALGLSRSSTMALSEHIREDSLDEAGAFRWIVENNWREFGFARLVELEIERVIENRGREFVS